MVRSFCGMYLRVVISFVTVSTIEDLVFCLSLFSAGDLQRRLLHSQTLQGADTGRLDLGSTGAASLESEVRTFL